MKKMKKILAGVLGLSLLLTALAVPSMAEEQTAPAAQTAGLAAKGGRNQNGPRGRMPGNNGQNQSGPRGQAPGSNDQNQSGPQGQAPGNNDQNQSGPRGQAPGSNDQNQNGPQGQAPGNSRRNQKGPRGQAPGSNGQNQNGSQDQAPDANSQATPPASDANGQNSDESQTSDGNSQNAPNGQTSGTDEQNAKQDQNAAPGKNGKQGRGKGGHRNNGTAPADQEPAFDLQVLVDNGIIDQETADKIDEFLKNSAPGQTAENQAQADSTTPPEKPEGDQAPVDGMTPPEMPENTAMIFPEDLLAKLVENGLLTQEQADAISALSVTTENSPAETMTAAADTANTVAD